MKRSAFAKALIYTIITTYPFALLVTKLSRIDEATFVPCSHRIINPLHNSWCRVLYVWCIAGWSIAKVLHDWLLLGGAHEYTTLRIGCISIFFQLMAVSLAFFWSMGAVEVFAAEIVPGQCACYYVLPELEAILAIGTPCLLFVNAVKKLENVHRAPLVGDYLYYQQYDLPFRLALKSGAVDSNTCLIGTAHGYYHEEWQDQLAINQLRCLHTVHQILCYVLFLGVVSACVGVAIGPVTARAIELLLSSKQAGSGTLNLLLAVLVVVVWFFPTYLILRLLEALPMDFKQCRTVPELWEYEFPIFNLVVRVAFILFLAMGLPWASIILTSPLVEVLMHRHVTFNAKVALHLAFAGILYFGFGVQMFVWIVYLIPTHRALFVKARMPYRPSSYIEIGRNHPEFNLAKEVQLAKLFLKENRNPESLEWVDGWQERWRETLEDPDGVDALVKRLQRYTPKVHGFVADLSLMSDVRKLGEQVSKEFPVIHGLLNNAGTFAGDYTGQRKETLEGNEYSLAVNVMAPFLLTSLLLENVRASGAGRVLITSSISAGSNDALNDLKCQKRWSDHRAYELSKLCDAMITMELHARYGDPPKLCFHTMDPGTVDTKMLRAGWGSWGSPVSTATTSFEMLTQVFTDRLGEASKKKVEPDLEFFIKDFQSTFPELEPAV
ncbi:unnamed protein product [Cladocopium goreaui]|uniref:Short-chain dehydrogenase/reductase bet4 (Betaenone biosynthesis cluster protein 4) n=1 Tax=Cladocopium goreaui TaxID=2562237 RepID=A0A9P1FU23_9DINO|nr:unnamed protein product [Cladocopium goreaui]